MDLFDYMRANTMEKESPLASRMRPTTLDEVVGQKHIIGKDKLLYRAIKADQLNSVIFYGPPGTGKTTLAKVIANTTSARFEQINATVAGKKDMEEIVKNAKDSIGMYGQKTILFVDEIHRFNKSQQDYLLPFVEDGTITLIGATTENPYFEVNNALLSRSRIFELKPLEKQDIRELVMRAVYDTEKGMGTYSADITDEAAVWEVLMQPITVVDGHQQAFIYVRSEPSDDAEAVGEITCASQGVHVLETLDNGWSRIEAYSSSFADSKVKAYAKFISGYVPTKKLKQIKPSQEYGLVVDKLTQRLYLFKEGKLYSTMLCSTGLVNKDQPWNETMSGEYLIVSASGGFMSGNMHCAMGMRFNDGDKMHEVPYILNRDGSKNYGYTEPDLGKRASHGCLRVQRKRTPEGVNMAWLWNNRAKNVKLLIWEDWPGRQIPIPADDFQLYYNPNGGVSYHSQATCYSIKNSKNVTMQAFTYGELEQEPYASLKRCEYCAPALRRAEYEEINAQYRALEASGAETSFELTN